MTQIIKQDGTMEGPGSVWVLDANGRAKINAHLLDGLHADATGAADAHVVATDASGDAKVVDLTASGGLNVGTATGAGAGQVRASGYAALAGTHAPVDPLDVGGTVWIREGSFGGLGAVGKGLRLGASSTVGMIFARDYASGSSSALPLALNSVGGNVLIGTTSDDGVNRLQVNGSVKATYGEMNWLQILDGVAAPATVSGWARIYVDSADGDLKIKFGDGTVKTIVTD